jgi:hypothetical protein
VENSNDMVHRVLMIMATALSDGELGLVPNDASAHKAGYRRTRLLAWLQLRVRPMVWPGVVLVLKAAVAAIEVAVTHCWSRLVWWLVDVPADQSWSQIREGC